MFIENDNDGLKTCVYHKKAAEQYIVSLAEVPGVAWEDVGSDMIALIPTE